MIGIQPLSHFSYICGHGQSRFLGPERLTVNERELLRLVELMFLETAHNPTCFYNNRSKQNPTRPFPFYVLRRIF